VIDLEVCICMRASTHKPPTRKRDAGANTHMRSHMRALRGKLQTSWRQDIMSKAHTRRRRCLFGVLVVWAPSCTFSAVHSVPIYIFSYTSPSWTFNSLKIMGTNVTGSKLRSMMHSSQYLIALAQDLCYSEPLIHAEGSDGGRRATGAVPHPPGNFAKSPLDPEGGPSGDFANSREGKGEGTSGRRSEGPPHDPPPQ
jgi:hypothetical protein